MTTTDIQAPALSITAKIKDEVHGKYCEADYMADQCRQRNIPTEQQWRDMAD